MPLALRVWTGSQPDAATAVHFGSETLMGPRTIFSRIRVALVLIASASACQSDSLFVPSERLTPEVRLAMDSLILREWRSAAIYAQARLDFGESASIEDLAAASGRNATTLGWTYRRFAIFPPANPYGVGSVARFNSLLSACVSSVESAAETATRYAHVLTLAAPGAVKQVMRENRLRIVEREMPGATRCAALASRG